METTKTITIREIHIINFKGFRNFNATFNGNEVEFRGDNATGKTSLYDAFCWVLTGKDSAGRADTHFELKTLTSDNKVIERIPHEVEVIFDINGEELSIRKVYNEVWKKKRGCVEEVFSGHTVERFWNNVPLSESEFVQKIYQEICSEFNLKLLTNPLFFMNQEPKYKRAFLLDLAGNVTPDSIADEYPEFKDLVDGLGNKSIDDYKKEVEGNLKRVSVEKSGYTDRIDERKRDVPEEEDWTSIEKQIDDLNEKMKDIDSALADKAKAMEKVSDRRLALQMDINSLKGDLEARKRDVELQTTKSWYERQNAYQKKDYEVKQMKSSISQWRDMIDKHNDEIIVLGNERAKLLDEYNELKNKKFEIDESALVCPKCMRPFEGDDRESIIAKQKDAFNIYNAGLVERNIEKGRAIGEKRTALENAVEDLKAKIDRKEEELIVAQKELKALEPGERPKVNIEEDTMYQNILNTIADKEAERESIKVIANDTDGEMRNERTRLTNELNDLSKRLGKREVIEANEKRIEFLEKSYKDMCIKEAELIGILETISAYKKRVVEKVEQKVNAMFKTIVWKLYKQQINGGEVEICEALVDGVPYSTNVNSAGRINAGLDFISAVQAKFGIHLPVWIDNKETVTKLFPLECQTITLVKDENYNTLTKTIG